MAVTNNNSQTRLYHIGSNLHCSRDQLSPKKPLPNILAEMKSRAIKNTTISSLLLEPVAVIVATA